ncbi:baseplate J/gp47 family protein [Pseudomonas sp. MAFF 302030]|uniref:Baseplate J/gp47 family protein n=1 Tax=Pseudomonas morbosilactucae TaxID=2938197 RepID=A0A9X1Z6B5_9PSED|nr:baseplate J/gp47 family protein [Pseudomonas morbosilactucae]MCK9802082.1 baseplate J/gp47 family protein [Pseudomonas morbosilactucae]
MASLTSTGYVLQTQNEWFAQERQFYLDIDPLWNLDPSTPDGLKMAHDSEIFYALDETLQQAYNSKDPNKAKGNDLDIVCSLTGTIRSGGSRSNTPLTLIATPGTVIPAGNRFESITTGSRWATDQTVTADSLGSATVNATCTVVGPTQADAGTITRIVDVVAGLSSVTNSAPATPGSDGQRDEQLRVTRATAVGRPGNNQTDSMIGELFSVDGVRRVKVYENDTDSSAVSADNPYGLPRHSIAPIIDGGTDDDVAMAIYLKKNPGATLYQPGTPFEVDVTSPKYPTNKKLIRASRPIYVDMIPVIHVVNDGTLPPNADQLIKEAMMEYAAGDLIPADVGFKIDGFDIGETVPFSTIFTPVNKVIGAYGDSYVDLPSSSLNGGQTNVSIAYNQMSRWTESNITVVIT